MTIRRATVGDRDAVLALGVAEEAAWFGASELSMGEIGEWVDEQGGVERGVVAVDETGGVLGFASAGLREALFLAHPARIDRLADELLPWLLEQRAAVEFMTFAGDRARVRAFERHGLRHVRSAFSLARPELGGPVAAAQFPEGVEVTRYTLGEADEAVHRLIYVDAEWTAVPGHADRDLDAWREKERPCGSTFLAHRAGRPVGWVAGRLLDSGRGYINTLAVAVSERGRGLGRALLLVAFADLQAAGAGDLTLAVEASNEAALGLYRSVGLEVEREWSIHASDASADDG